MSEGFRGLSTIRNERIDGDFRRMEVGLKILIALMVVYLILTIVEACAKIQSA